MQETQDRWVVVENTPGYLPESEPADFDTYAGAVAYANELADELETDGYTTDRSVASGENTYAIYAERSDTVAPDLGRVIEVLHDAESEDSQNLDESGSATVYALGIMALVVVPVLTFVVRVFGEVGGVLS